MTIETETVLNTEASEKASVVKPPWQYHFRSTLFLVILLIVVLLTLLRMDRFHLPREMIVGLVLLLFSLPTLLWWSWADEKIQLWRQVSGQHTRGRRLCYLTGLYALLLLVPPVLLAIGGGWRLLDQLPRPVLMWTLAWHLSLVVLMPIALVLRPVRRLVRLVKRLTVPVADRRNASPGNDRKDPQDGAAFTRRDLLASALAAAPVVLAGGFTAGGMLQQGQWLIRKMQVRLPGLPSRLRGLTVTHISDTHVGRLFVPDYLPRLVEQANRLESDLVMMTGDYIDHAANFLPAAMAAMQQINGRYGRYMVIGNHDLIEAPQYAYEYITAREPNFLRDAHRRLEIGGETLQIVGLDWSRYEEGTNGQRSYAQRVEQAMNGLDPDGFTIGLAHHPHAFDALAGAGVNLTLSGHTHGGQLNLTSPGSEITVGAGNLLFRYIHGLYRRADAALYVNAGAGNWFPVRINAPAEIVQIRLI